MKRNFLFCATAITIALLALAACTADQDLYAPGHSGNTRIIAETRSMGSDTRTAVDPTEYGSGEIGINWLPADRIGVFGSLGSANIPFSNSNMQTAPKAVFTGDLNTGESPIYAYYPYSQVAGTDVKAIKGNLPLTQSYDLSTGAIGSDYKYGQPIAGAEQGRFAFNHLFAFLKFDIDATGSSLEGELLESITISIPETNLGGDFTFDATSGELTMAPGSNSEMVMKWTTSPALTPSLFHGYMSVAPTDLSGKTISIKITTSGHVASFDVAPKVSSLEKNSYYTLPLTLSLIEKEPSFKLETRDDVQAEVKPGYTSRLACANRVFSLPSTPFMHKIRVPEKEAVISVTGLPEGLTWNAKRRLVQGQVAAEGDYVYTVNVTTTSGETYREGVALKVSSSLQMPVPFMGWLSWNVVEKEISETVVRQVADALVSKGLATAGYKYVVMDDFWHAADRDDNFNPVADKTKFPNGIKAVSDYVHGKGLKIGIYSDAGCKTCGGMFGSQNFEEEDAKAYAEWGIDLLKYDFCFAGNCTQGNSLGVGQDVAFERYKTMCDALKAQNRDIILYMCEWGMNQPWKWGAETGATTWRCTYDSRDGWNGKTSGNSIGIGVKQSLEQMRHLWPYAGVNRFNDADMMCVGIHGTGKSSNDLVEFSQSTGSFFNKKNLGMTDDEYQTQFVMWCMWSSPLTLSFDVRNKITDFDLKLMTNPELIAINQDAMGQQAEFIKSVGNLDYYCKDLANGDVAIAVVNLGDSSANYSIYLGDYDALDANASYSLRNLLARSADGSLSSAQPKTGTLNKHATVVYRLSRN